MEMAVAALPLLVVGEGDVVEEVEEIRQSFGAEGVNFDSGHERASLCAPACAGGCTFIVCTRPIQTNRVQVGTCCVHPRYGRFLA